MRVFPRIHRHDTQSLTVQEKRFARIGSISAEYSECVPVQPQASDWPLHRDRQDDVALD